MKHGWRCWFRGWAWELTPRGAWITRTCRRCGHLEVSLLGLFWDGWQNRLARARTSREEQEQK